MQRHLAILPMLFTLTYAADSDNDVEEGSGSGKADDLDDLECAKTAMCAVARTASSR